MKEDGTLGTPEIMGKFTSEWNGAQGKHSKKDVPLKVFKADEIGEIYL